MTMKSQKETETIMEENISVKNVQNQNNVQPDDTHDDGNTETEKSEYVEMKENVQMDAAPKYVNVATDLHPRGEEIAANDPENINSTLLAKTDNMVGLADTDVLLTTGLNPNQCVADNNLPTLVIPEDNLGFEKDNEVEMFCSQVDNIMDVVIMDSRLSEIPVLNPLMHYSQLTDILQDSLNDFTVDDNDNGNVKRHKSGYSSEEDKDGEARFNKLPKIDRNYVDNV